MYYTGMRFGEAVNLRWEMYKPDRRMLILPPSATKEGKNERKAKVKAKRVPLREEVVELLESLRTRQGNNVVQAIGFIFGYCGNFNNRSNTYQGKPMDRCHGSEVLGKSDKAYWSCGTSNKRLSAHVENERSKVWDCIRLLLNAIVGHASIRPVEDRYIHVSDEELLTAVDSMTFDHGGTQLDFVEEAVMEAPPEKGMEGVWKTSLNEKIRTRVSAATPNFRRCLW